ncbi:hypothetical protein Tco_0052604 [Tanacetum coccineum]
MREVISKVGLVDFKSCWSVIRENGISKLLQWNNALFEVISKVGLVDLMAVRMRDEEEWVGVKTKPGVVKAPVAKAKADVGKAPVAKDNDMGFKMNYMEGQELNEITCNCRRITWDSR